MVTDGAGIAVLAGQGVVDMCASRLRVAEILGAGVVVRAVELAPAAALSDGALLTDRARVCIVAGQPFVVRGSGAGTIFRVADGLLAGCVWSLRQRTVYRRSRCDVTLVGQLLLVAEESAVAEVAVLQLRTVGILLAVACDGIAGTDSCGAGVCHGAWVVVVAGGLVELEVAAPQPVADIVGTGVVVVASDGRSHADSLFAVVSDGARVSVQAFPRFEDVVGTTVGPVAGVLGAVIVVVAEVYVVASDLLWFVGFSIAIVVHAIAGFLSRFGGVARGKPLRCADGLALALTPLVAATTRRPQQQLSRLLGAGADARVRHALHRLQAVRGQDIFAREAPGALLAVAAPAAAEATALSVVDADVLGTAYSLAVRPGRARPAEVREVGDTDVDQIGVGAGHLLAVPARRAFVLAPFCAYALAHMLDAPLRFALGVLRALVQKAALARQATGLQSFLRLPDLFGGRLFGRNNVHRSRRFFHYFDVIEWNIRRRLRLYEVDGHRVSLVASEPGQRHPRNDQHKSFHRFLRGGSLAVPRRRDCNGKAGRREGAGDDRRSMVPTGTEPRACARYTRSRELDDSTDGDGASRMRALHPRARAGRQHRRGRSLAHARYTRAHELDDSTDGDGASRMRDTPARTSWTTAPTGTEPGQIDDGG